MSMAVNLPDELAARLAAEAARRGVSPEQVAMEAIEARLPAAGSSPGRRRRLAFAAIGASTSGRRASEAEEMLAEGFGRS